MEFTLSEKAVFWGASTITKLNFNNKKTDPSVNHWFCCVLDISKEQIDKPFKNEISTVEVENQIFGEFFKPKKICPYSNVKTNHRIMVHL